MNSYDLFPQYPVRPGVGQTQGSIVLVATTPSVFQVVRSLPPSANNFVEYARFNFAWAATNGTDGLAIAFGPADNATLDTALTGAPVFPASAVVTRSFLLVPTDTGFKARGTGGGTLTWWLG